MIRPTPLLIITLLGPGCASSAAQFVPYGDDYAPAARGERPLPKVILDPTSSMVANLAAVGTITVSKPTGTALEDIAQDARLKGHEVGCDYVVLERGPGSRGDGRVSRRWLGAQVVRVHGGDHPGDGGGQTGGGVNADRGMTQMPSMIQTLFRCLIHKAQPAAAGV